MNKKMKKLRAILDRQLQEAMEAKINWKLSLANESENEVGIRVLTNVIAMIDYLETK